jgi:hypothetical protein
MALTSASTEAEFELMLSDVGVAVSCGPVNDFGLLDYDDQVIEGETGFQSSLGAGTQKRGGVIGRQLILTVLTSTFADADLSSDQPITVDGQDYEISYSLSHLHMALDLTAIYLRKV